MKYKQKVLTICFFINSLKQKTKNKYYKNVIYFSEYAI